MNIKQVTEAARTQLHSNLYKGKTIAIVGPSEKIRGTKQAEFIESHDIVVRINTAIEYMPFEDALALDIGARTDVLYVSFGHLIVYVTKRRRKLMFANIIDFKDSLDDNKIGTVVCANSTSNARMRKFKNFFGEIGTNVSMVHPAVGKWVGKKIFMERKKPTSGFVTILDCLLQDTERVYITGFTFYNDFTNMFRGKEEEAKSTYVSQEFFTSQGHHWSTELAGINKMKEIFQDRLQFDKTLKELASS